MAEPMATLSEFKSALRLNIDMLPGVGQERHLCILISETPFSSYSALPPGVCSRGGGVSPHPPHILQARCSILS